jgi:two-component system, NarL family, response regulator NreC
MLTRVLLADDHTILRQGLASLLGATPGLAIVGEAANGRKAVELAAQWAPDVVVMDVAMPDLNGIEATRQIKARCPAIKVIGLSMHSDERFIAGMLRAGAAGYLLKEGAFEELAQAIRAVVANQTYLSPRVAGTVVQDYLRTKAAASPPGAEILSNREREVLQLIAEGWTTKRVAVGLGVSVKTVETHRRRIKEALGLESVAELTKYAVRQGLTSLEK